MTRTLENIKNQIMALNPPDKAELLRILICALEHETEDGVAQSWLEEAKRRRAELAGGTVSPVPASVVFQRARERLGE